MASMNWKECKSCPKRNNKLACLLHECEVREQKYKETIRRWHKEWAQDKLCFACEHCKHREAWDHSYRTTEAYCELTGELILEPDTCDKWVEGDYEDV